MAWLPPHTPPLPPARNSALRIPMRRLVMPSLPLHFGIQRSFSSSPITALNTSQAFSQTHTTAVCISSKRCLRLSLVLREIQNPIARRRNSAASCAVSIILAASVVNPAPSSSGSNRPAASPGTPHAITFLRPLYTSNPKPAPSIAPNSAATCLRNFLCPLTSSQHHRGA